MALTRKQWIIIAGIAAALAVAIIVGVTVGVVVGRQKSSEITVEARARNVLSKYPLIDG